MRLHYPLRLIIIAVVTVWGALLAAVAVQAREQVVFSLPYAQAEFTPTPEPASTDASAPTSHVDESGSSPWSAPQNLSRSGGVLAIRSVVDSEGIIHVIWTEEGIETLFYSYSDGNEWTEPLPLEAPFGTRQFYPELSPSVPTPLFVPELVSDSNGRIYAFWIDEANVLWESSVGVENFAEFEAWEDRQQLSEAVIETAVRSDEAGRVHLAYVRNMADEELPVGVYYQQLDEDAEWLAPVPLYQSSYLRMVSVETVNLQLETNDNGESIYVVWDDPALEKVFVNISRDAGQAWQPVREVDSRQPTDVPQAEGPHGIMVSASGDDIILVWKAAHTGGTCNWFYESSDDNGVSWSGRTVFEQLADCSMTGQLFTANGQPNYLLAAGDDEVQLLQWNGERWSEPQFQETVTRFINVDTNQVVNLGCHQVYLDGRGTVQVVGCSTGVVRDVWYAKRAIGATEDWYPPPNVWNAPSTVATYPSEVDELKLVADVEGHVHALWTTVDDNEIYYARWAGSWSQGVPVLQSPEEKALHPDIMVTGEGRLFVVWSDSQSGTVYFSTARVDGALTPGDWSAPQIVAAVEGVATSPNVVLAPDGVIYVTYIVPYNQGRGIYFVRSADGGVNWAAPVLVVDGETMGPTAINNLQSTASVNGSVHIQWELHSLARRGISQALYYSRSWDGGETWSAPESVMEGSVSWNELVTGSSGIVFRVWQESDGQQLTLRYQASSDQGGSWTFPALIAGAQDGPAPAGVTLDADGRAHLLQLNNQVLEHWVSEGELWRGADAFELDQVETNEYSLLSAAVDAENRLFVAYAGRWAQSSEEPATNAVRFTSSDIARPETTSTPVPATFAPTATAAPLEPASLSATSTVPATAIPSPNATQQPASSGIEQNSGSATAFLNDISDPTVRMLVAILPAALIVLIVLGLRIRASRLNRR